MRVSETTCSFCGRLGTRTITHTPGGGHIRRRCADAADCVAAQRKQGGRAPRPKQEVTE